MWGVCKLGSGVNVGNVNLGQHQNLQTICKVKLKLNMENDPCVASVNSRKKLFEKD